MEGGIAILLLLIVFVVGGGIALVMYLTGGSLLARGKDGLEEQPEPVEQRHIAPDSVVGDDDPAKRDARRAERAARRRRRHGTA
jgi:hypothetical protein